MVQPLALVVYEKLLPGTQLLNRLQDLNYRVRAVTDPAVLPLSAEQEKPMLVLADLECKRTDVCVAIEQLKKNPATQHIPVIAFVSDSSLKELEPRARAAGVTLIASET